MGLKLILRDRNRGLVDAWNRWFETEPIDVTIEHSADIFESPADSIISPANRIRYLC